MAALPWRQRPLQLFPEADPRVWASLRKRALDLVLNADLCDLSALREVAKTLTENLGHGARRHNQDWMRLWQDLEVVKCYALSQTPELERLYDLATQIAPDSAHQKVLRELHPLCQQVYILDPDLRSTCSTLSTTDAAPPASAPSIRTIAAEVFWTVQFLKDHNALEVKRCRREECGRWFVDLKGYTESCSDDCRIAYAQGR